MENVDNLDALVSWMRSRGVKLYEGQIKTPYGERVVRIDIELAWRPTDALSENIDVMQVARALSDDPESLCACGHHLWTEHGTTGCLMGCSEELCNSNVSTEPESEQ